MRYGFVMPFGDARTIAQAALMAEEVGWDGIFVWEPVWGVDAWVALAAAAMVTQHIRLGTMLSPIARMRPWKLASETATLDNLSDGRVNLAVGLGAPDTGYVAFGEVIDRKLRAELTDEGLAILTGLWAGQPFAFQGKHYTIKPTNFNPPPPPVQQPRIPIWVVGVWPSEKSMQRVLLYDGLLPSVLGLDGKTHQASPEEVREMAAYVAERRTLPTRFDIVVEGQTPGDDQVGAVEQVAPWIEAGATWWIETMWEIPNTPAGLATVRQRIAQGPPRA
ncbi:luciferase-like protein [Oscillochloris trichoides DG-6]|uniref:Luciferase-like protein n=1 Tax=Oscillochloris trichoides DG-6 TaxID=765420 RepID=E1IEH2_9CHLR|nr:LLM class flavin-dependent oxidoreductase [Oscillochloris trichoides]EFO80498.1 luciferase-like protein [Oscillochloris trichoides DG-6]